MENTESKNSKTGLWNLLFGKKKKNSQKKNNCNCCENCHGEKKDKTVQTNNSVDDKEDGNIPILNINTYSNAKEMQKNKDCPGKVFPSERRGCGFHLYFCIDKMQKSDTAKIKKNKNTNLEINKAVDFQNIEVGQRSVAGDNEVNSITESEQTSFFVKNSQSTMSVLNKKGNLTGMKMSNEAMGDQPKNTIIEEQEVEKETNDSLKIQDDQKLVIKRSILRDQNTASKTLIAGSLQSPMKRSNISLKSSVPVNGEQTAKVPVVRISSVETPIFPEDQIFKNGEKGDMECHRSFLLSDPDGEAVFKGLEILQKQKLRRKSSMRSKTGNTFVRNSLISLRRDRRSSVDTMVPQILLKLNNIEDKIAELEKVYEERGKNIMNIVGISCNSTKSTLSIDVKDQDGKKDMNNQFSPETGPKTNTTVVIKSYGEDIVLNAPENISITKKRNKQESNQLIYHNTQELDAHSIASYSYNKSRTIKNQKPKSDVEASIQAMGFCDSQASAKWRRISEELKFN